MRSSAHESAECREHAILRSYTVVRRCWADKLQPNHSGQITILVVFFDDTRTGIVLAPFSKHSHVSFASGSRAPNDTCTENDGCPRKYNGLGVLDLRQNVKSVQVCPAVNKMVRGDGAFGRSKC